jgi:hypothetical protein
MKTMNVTPETTMGVSALARLTGHNRETASKRLRTHNIQPCGQKGNSPQYKLTDAIPAIYADAERGGANAQLALARAEKISQQIEAEGGLKNGELIRTADVIGIFRTGVAMLDELSPKLQGALALTDKETAELGKFVNGIRTEWTEKLQSIGKPAPAAGG